MNLNERLVNSHVEFEPNTYYASVSGELEASASPMWALVSHIKTAETRGLAENCIRHCLTAIKEWFQTINFMGTESVRIFSQKNICLMLEFLFREIDSRRIFFFQIDEFKASFHIPLHRYFAVFLRQAVKNQGFTLKDLLPDPVMLALMMLHPLKVQVGPNTYIFGS